MRHESEFIHIRAALKPFDNELSYLRTLNVEAEPTSDTQLAVALIAKIVKELGEAYDLAGNEALAHSSKPIANARAAMFELLEKGEKLAARKIGIPFFREWGGTPEEPANS